MGSPEAFQRAGILLGEETLERLRVAHVAVAGLGAVGGFAVEFLARLGVGRFTLVDFDRASTTNLNRHVAVLATDVGRPKTDLLRERVLAINPQADVEALPIFLHEETLPQLLDRDLDALVDAIDSLLPKVLLLQAAYGRSYFVISSMGAGGRLDPSRVQVADISRTTFCPLARQLRKRLHRLGIRKGIRTVFSDEPPLPPGEAGDSADFCRGRARRAIGTVSYMPAVFGAHLAREVLNALVAPRR